MRVVFVHGACVRDGAWWWHPTAELLAVAGISSAAPGLPSCGETGQRTGTGGPALAADVDAVRAGLQASDEPLIAVAPSYGGMVLSSAAAGLPQVRHLLYIASFLPEVGESLSSFGNGEPAPYLEMHDDGTFSARSEMTAEIFLQDCDPALVTPARDRLIRQTAAAVAEPATASAWQQIPSTYLVCAEDRGTPPSLQRRQGYRAGRTVELAAGHHPFLSQPAAVSELIREIAAAGPDTP